METPHITYASDRLTALLEEICRALTKFGAVRFVDVGMQLMIWNRLVGMSIRFENLAARLRSGRLAVAVARRVGSVRRARERRPAGEMLPRHFRWLVNMIPEIEQFGARLCWLLQRLEMEEFVDAAPQAGRILRPLCKMLGVEPTLVLRTRIPVPVRVPDVEVYSEADCPKTAADGMCVRWREPELWWRIDQMWWKAYGLQDEGSEKMA